MADNRIRKLEREVNTAVNEMASARERWEAAEKALAYELCRTHGHAPDAFFLCGRPHCDFSLAKKRLDGGILG